MVQVNLIGKKRREKAGKNWIMISLIAGFSALTLYFLGSTLYVVIRLYQLNAEIDKVDNEVKVLSAEILANKDSLSKFVLSKFTLDRVASLKKERFRYKDYLDQISKLVPTNSVLTNVDFTTKGWVAVSVSLPGAGSLKEIESNLTNSNKLAESEFISVFSELIAVDKAGIYNAKLHFEIKPNGGK
jgi:hypothetical protein